MSNDGELVHELVTTKYKIAEKNRIAKYQFLNKTERKKSAVINRRDSEPLTTTMETNVNVKIDYSVPGTPISSRNIDQLKRNYNNIESDSEDEANLNGPIVGSTKPLNSLLLQESLRKFTADMLTLQHEETETETETPVPSVSCDEPKPLDTYFVDSDKKNTYRREFSDVAGTIDFGPKPSNKEKVEQYFQESIRLNSFQREFPMETFNPQSNKFYNLSIPGTPISSRFITPRKSEVTHNLIETDSDVSNESDQRQTDDEDDEGADGESDDNLSIVTMKNSREEINIEQDCNGVICASEKDIIQESTTTELTKSVCEIIVKDEKGVKLNITVPGTPVSSRRVSTISTGTCSLADDSNSVDDYNVQVTKLANECVNVIEDLLQKVLQDEEKIPEELNFIKAGNEGVQHLVESFKDDGGDDAEKEETATATATTTTDVSKSISSLTEQKTEATSLELLNLESSENIQSYLEKSSLENSYQRTFSEVEKFNEPLPGVKRKIDKYFQESEQKMTFQRPFSEVFSYLVNVVEPNIKVNDLTIPGTPISSQQIMSLKHDQVQINTQCDADGQKTEPFSVNDYFQESQNRNTFQRTFSETVDKMGMPSIQANDNSNTVDNYFTTSDQQKSYRRQFSDAIQEMPSRIEDILLDKQTKVTNGINKQRASSVCSNQSNKSTIDGPTKIYGKNYGIDKYFATSLYRTAYHRSAASRGQPTEHNDDINDELGSDNSLNINEEESALDEQKQSNQTKVRHCSENLNSNTHQQFWKDFMKPSI